MLGSLSLLRLYVQQCLDTHAFVIVQKLSVKAPRARVGHTTQYSVLYSLEWNEK